MNSSALTRDALTAFARANRSRFEGLLRDFVECPTVSVDPERKGAIADGVRLAVETIRAFGGSAKVHESGGNPLVSGQWRRKPDGKFDLVIVDNQHAPIIPVGGKMEPIG